MITPSKVYNQLIENMQDWPIAKLSNRRGAFVKELVKETMDQFNTLSKDELKAILSTTIFNERKRVVEEPWKVDPPKEAAYWSKFRTKVFNVDQNEDDETIKAFYLQQIHEVVNSYAEEIVGSFKEKSFRFARRFLTFFFGRLLNAAANKKFKRIVGSKYRIHDRIKAYGPIDTIRHLFSKGTVVVVPTHFSNIDSVLVGYAMDEILGLPSFSYGAGLNLLNNGAVAYYINRMGAYRLDRRKKNPLYLTTLKQFSKLSIEQGVNSLFFPGGTRSRSGELEGSLKLGLLGTVVEAQKTLYKNDRPEKIFVVPLVMSYHFVLEAKFLIDQHLRKSGKEKYFKSKDQSYSIWKSLKFTWELFANTSQIKLSFGQPMDVLGNLVDDEGHSESADGNHIRLKEYFSSNGVVTQDDQRDQVYTRKLAERIVERYHKENIVLASHLVAFTLYHLIRCQHQDLDIYDFLILDPADYQYSIEDFGKAVTQVKDKLLQLEKNGDVRVANDIHELSIEELIKHGISAVGTYHDKRPVKIPKKTQMVITEDLNLLLFYSNRLEHYDLHIPLYESQKSMAKIGDYI